MNRDELLTKLAMELVEWPEFSGAARSLGYRSMWKWKIDEWDLYLISIDMKYQIRKEHWLDRRMELINEPDDTDAPPQAKYKLQGPTGQWYWAWGSEPVAIFVHSTGFEGWNVDSMCSEKATKGECPAGHDWRATLREVKRAGVCSDGTQCGTFAETAYCSDCPNAEQHQHIIDSQRLDAQLKEAIRHGYVADNAGELLGRAAELEKHATCTPEEDEEFDRIMQRQCEKDVAKHYHHFYKGIKLDPYRIARIYKMNGGPREQIMKKTLRFTDKGQTEQQVVNELRKAIDRWQEMLDEDAAN